MNNLPLFTLIYLHALPRPLLAAALLAGGSALVGCHSTPVQESQSLSTPAVSSHAVSTQIETAAPEAEGRLQKEPPVAEIPGVFAPESEPKLQAVQRALTLPVARSGALLDENALAQLDALAAEIMDWDRIEHVRLVGHTDSEGSEASNELLARKRAEAAAARLLALGLDKSKIEILAKGEREPIADNTSLSGRAMNRRIEILVQGQLDANSMAAEPSDLDSSLAQAAN